MTVRTLRIVERQITTFIPPKVRLFRQRELLRHRNQTFRLDHPTRFLRQRVGRESEIKCPGKIARRNAEQKEKMRGDRNLNPAMKRLSR